MLRLGYNEKLINEVYSLIKLHDTKISDSMLNNYDFVTKLYKIQYCDAFAHHPDKLEKRKKYLIKIKNKLEKSKGEYNV